MDHKVIFPESFSIRPSKQLIKAKTLNEIFLEIQRLSPTISKKIFKNQKEKTLRSFVSIFINGARINPTLIPQFKFLHKSEVRFVMAIAGG